MQIPMEDFPDDQAGQSATVVCKDKTETISSLDEIIQIKNKLSCILIGTGSLLIQCVEMLLISGHIITAIVSSDKDVRSWAKQKNINCFAPVDDWKAFINNQAFDLLFSIINDIILPEEILARPRLMSINYHDGPLPKYAGTYVTSWAIMHGETTHGVTWHVMDKRVDSGDILKQRIIPVDDNEIASSLNVKCFESALQLFKELSDDLTCGPLARQNQALEARSFFPRHQRPPAACILSWRQTAHAISAFVRGLNFGIYANALGLPKLAIGNDFLIVDEIDILATRTPLAPGTICRITADTVEVTTNSYDIALRMLRTLAGVSLPIAAVVRQYSLHTDYCLTTLEPALAQAITERNAAICTHEPFWIERLSALQPLTLPYTKPSGKAARYVDRLVSLPEELTTFLAAQPALRAEVFFLAAFGAYCARVSDNWNFDLGFSHAKLESAAPGIFSAQVPFRISLNPAHSFTETALAVQKEVDLVQRHQTYVHDIALRYPAIRAAAAAKEVLSVSVAWVKEAGAYTAVPGSVLTLVISEDTQECRLLYDAERLDEISIIALLNPFQAFLQGIAHAPGQNLATVPMLTPGERQQILDRQNVTTAKYAQSVCLHELFEAQVAKTPAAIALTCGDLTLTYDALNRQANQLAYHLRSLGVGPESLVGLCLERSMLMLVGLLGILKAGGAYVPLDPGYPAARLAFMLDDARISMLVTQQDLLERLPDCAAKVLCLDTAQTRLAAEPVDNVTSGAVPENPAYIIYTSGSTGQPKGVVITHANVVRLMAATENWFQFNDTDVWTLFHSCAFDFSVWEIWGALLHGGRLVIVPYAVSRDPEAFHALLHSEQVTVLNQTPSAFRQLMHAEARVSQKALALRYVIFGGEALELHSLLPWFERHSDTLPQLVNMYGITETTVHVTYRPLTLADVMARTGSVIGKPIPDLQVYILDAQRQPVPVGVAGELYVGGAGLARGYLRRPELTEERFIAHPYSDDSQARLYRSGDLARYLPDGDIEYLGRIDHQVKVRGFRIELGEIEAQLSRHPQVREAVVIAREDTPGDQRLVGYIVSQGTAAPGNLELRNFLREQLPEYMLPAAFVMLPNLPLTAHGKVDQRALPTPESVTPTRPDTDYAAPTSALEQTIAAVWQDVFQRDRVGRDDNFFDLGGHSLLMVSVHARLRELVPAPLSIVQLFQYPTVSALAKYLEDDDTDKQEAFQQVLDRAENQKRAAARQKYVRNQV